VTRRTALVLAAVVALGAALASRLPGQPGTHVHAPGTPEHTHPAAPAPVTLESPHAHGGVPPGWRFSFPQGDPRAGRQVFEKLECYKCHEVRGAGFPAVVRQPGESGPELTGMGPSHPAEYFAESILNPSAVIVAGPGYAGPDGLSIMPDYRDSLTVSELIDLVAYLRGLGGSAPAAGHGHGGNVPAPPTR
jgi:cytochrome c1